MVSDGYCVVPLLDDLAYLVARAEASAVDAHPSALADLGGSPTSISRSRLPSVPSAFEALESRISRTVISPDAGPFSGGGGSACDRGITRETFGKKVWREAFTTYAAMPADAVASVRRAARQLSVPDDIAMFTIVGITLAWFENKSTELITMIVPQRDGPSENDMVGLFADCRNLAISTKGLNFAGVALRLHHVVKERLWSTPGIATQFDVPFVNFEWTDFEERQGFSQNIRTFECAESSFYPLRVAVDQPNRDSWRMRVVFDKEKYSEEQRIQFFDLFERALHALLWHPLDPVWSADGRGADKSRNLGW